MSIDVRPQDIDAMLITHEHNDHIKGAGVVSRRYNIPIYATKGTHSGANIGAVSDENRQIITPHTDFEIGTVGVRAFNIPHDSAEPVGFCFFSGNEKYSSATDMQPQLVTYLTTVGGESTAREGVWDNRFKYTNELARMGADIHVEGKLAMIDGVGKLMGAHVRANDLRAGAAMIIAGLMAEGETEIVDIYHIDRGYERFEEKFISLGGDIKRIHVVDDFEE